MHSGGRRLLRRPQRRRRLLTIAAAGLVLFFLVVCFMPTAPPTDDALGDPQQWQQQQRQKGQLYTLKPPSTASTRPLGRPDNAGITDDLATPQPVPLETATPPPPPSPAGEHNKVKADGVASESLPAVENRKDGLLELYGTELEELARLDLFRTRRGEEKVTFERFAGCLAALLDVDPVARAETPRNDPNNMQQLPLLISITSGNTQDLKAMICNLTVPYKYVVLAQTGDTPEMTPFFDLLQRVFDFTSRLVVHQFKESIGFAGAANAGLREMLRHPFDEVPFVHILHNDVRYLHTALADSVKDAYLDAQKDKPLIAALEAEVKAEPSAATPAIRLPKGLRAPITPATNASLPQLRGSSAVLVTSALLPDRVRYLPDVERREVFRGHVSFAFHNSRGEYTAIYLTRLAVLAVGFFDENFYPVMFDDTDFRWRAQMLGFTEMFHGDFDDDLIAFDGDCTQVQVDGGGPAMMPPTRPLPGARGHAKRAGKPKLSPATQSLMRECATAFSRAVQFQYMALKWGVSDMMKLAEGLGTSQPYTAEVFSGKKHLPLDAWVVDTQRIAALKKSLLDTGAGGLEVAPYNPEVILTALP